ncbi:translation initiation factor IF-2 [Candidatus Parcubacteria bacterium]|nr:translation initiation factor IF-2 [Candidatus Parcubacteria bacterium]
MPDTKNKDITRPPVIVIMGHIDHGKSTLLDYIRHTNITPDEAGGITQHIAAYEVAHKDKKITFLDTPGHEAFSALRVRGVNVADIAVLVVSAEDGVKQQTLEALNIIKKEELPYIVAINKIDKPGADIERTKQNLAEHEIYIEGYGGSVPFVPISAKTGQGVPELLDMMLLVAELEELKADTTKLATGIVIESNLDNKKGITATLIIKDGTLSKGNFVVAGQSLSPTRIVEDFLGKQISEATVSSPIRIIGWDSVPIVGSAFQTFDSKKEAESSVATAKEATKKPVAAPSVKKKEENPDDEPVLSITIPVIVRSDTTGSTEALIQEIKKISTDKVIVQIISQGIGKITESDIKVALANKNSVVIGFHTSFDGAAKALALRENVTVEQSDIIYKLTEWLSKIVKERTPEIEVIETRGRAKILKLFSKVKDRQIVGGKVEMGTIVTGDVKIMRRETEIGTGRVRELQQLKNKVGEIGEGKEFGAMIESKIDIAPGDRIESQAIVKKSA